MKCLVTFKTSEQASENRRLLNERGIEAKIIVDPMEGIYPAHCTAPDVSILVSDEQYAAAWNILHEKDFRKAS